MKPKLISVVAVARNGCIGKDNALPWHIPEDLKRFKAITMGKPVVMGRKTYVSILNQLGRPLPGRPHYVLTRSPDWQPEAAHAEQVHRVDSLEEALWQCELQNEPEVMLIGGADVFAQALASTDVIELTEVDADVEGDAFFPDLVEAEWHREDLGAGQTEHGLAYRFVRLSRT